MDNIYVMFFFDNGFSVVMLLNYFGMIREWFFIERDMDIESVGKFCFYVFLGCEWG